VRKLAGWKTWCLGIFDGDLGFAVELDGGDGRGQFIRVVIIRMVKEQQYVGVFGQLERAVAEDFCVVVDQNGGRTSRLLL